MTFLPSHRALTDLSAPAAASSNIMTRGLYVFYCGIGTT